VLERKLPGSGSSTRNGGGIRSQLGTATNVRLSVLSEPYWAEFEDHFGIDPGLTRIGYLFLAASDDELETLRTHVDLQHRFGVASELLTAADVGARWPVLADLGFSGGGFCASDGYLNQHRALRGFLTAAEAAGATIECGIEVFGFKSEPTGSTPFVRRAAASRPMSWSTAQELGRLLSRSSSVSSSPSGAAGFSFFMRERSTPCLPTCRG